MIRADPGFFVLREGISSCEMWIYPSVDIKSTLGVRSAFALAIVTMHRWCSVENVQIGEKESMSGSGVHQADSYGGFE
jgi:hypothetical protein